MRRRRRLWIILFAAPLLLAAADTLYWSLAERNLEAGFADWIANRRAYGWTATAGPTMRGGWPLAATLSVPTVLLQGGDPEIPGGLAWSAERLVLRIGLLRPGLLEVAAEGGQRVRLGEAAEIPYRADRLRMTLPMQSGAPPHVADISAQNLRAGMPAGDEGSAGLTVGSADLHLESRPSAQAG